MVALDLSLVSTKPAYISLESEDVSFDKLRHEFDALSALGYNKFKLSPQHLVQQMKIAPSSVHGTFSDYAFEEHSSGPFGEDIKGPWLGVSEAIADTRAGCVVSDLYRHVH